GVAHRPVRHAPHQLHPLLAQPRLDQPHGLVDGLAQIDLAPLRGAGAGVVEQPLHLPLYAGHLGVHDLEVLRGQPVLPRVLSGHVDDHLGARQRVADLVRPLAASWATAASCSARSTSSRLWFNSVIISPMRCTIRSTCWSSWPMSPSVMTATEP